MASVARRPTVLIVLHQAHSTPGRVGLALRAMGVRLDIRRPSLDEPLPKTMADHDGVVIFGGPMCANDSCDWIQREIEWLETPLAEEKPLLGICLGAQMLARTLAPASSISRTIAARLDIFRSSRTPPATRSATRPFRAASTSGTRTASMSPLGRSLLATGGTNFPNQAYRYGKSAVALQFHPEVTYHMMCKWTLQGRRTADPAGRSGTAGPSRRLVPARRPRRRMAGGLSARLARPPPQRGLRRRA